MEHHHYMYVGHCQPAIRIAVRSLAYGYPEQFCRSVHSLMLQIHDIFEKHVEQVQYLASFNLDLYRRFYWHKLYQVPLVR